MKAKEKAKEIVERFINIIPCNDNELSEDEMYKEQLHSAKQCALICVDEILRNEVNTTMHPNDIIMDYWQEVKQEINKL
jgi:hypothetical protein